MLPSDLNGTRINKEVRMDGMNSEKHQLIKLASRLRLSRGGNSSKFGHRMKLNFLVIRGVNPWYLFYWHNLNFLINPSS